MNGLGEPHRPGSPPRPEVLAAVVSGGRRRVRRAALGGAGALATVTALVLGVGLLGQSDPDALLVEPASPEPQVSTSATTSPGVVPSASSTPAAASSAPQPSPADRPAVTPSPSGTAPVPGPTPGRQLPDYRERPSEEGYGDLCNGREVEVDGYALCVSVTISNQRLPQDNPATVELSLCNRLSNRRDLVLAFPGGREHDAAVRPNGWDEPAWTWSRHWSFPEGEHERSLPAGSCLRWGSSWDSRDDDGVLVPPGDYFVEATVDVNGTTLRDEMTFKVMPPE